ncbi:hypothetical protein RAN3_2545 [plant metagenome]|uniref:Uncharacterized protein n=1 Tax=plant metagenome TaxID=1297885 RepID=A0A484U3I9_9ZZZZ
MIWRPILAGKLALEATRSGQVDLMDVLKLNALLDAQDAALEAARSKATMKRGS